MRNKYFNLIILLFLGIFLISCSLEKKIAWNYIKQPHQRSVLLFFPANLIKTNLKTEKFGIMDSLGLISLDSVAPAKTLFLENLNDSLFISTCKQSMVRELEQYGFKVYEVDQMDEFLQLKDSSYSLNLAQMEVEEYVYEATADDFFESSSYNFKIDLNALNINSWFELNRNQVPNEKYPVLYSSYYIFDDVEGKFMQSSFDENISYRYKIDSLEMKDVYNLADFAGKKYAINLYDYLLNIYVQDHLPKGQIPNYYYHYARKGKVLLTWYDDSFIEMDQ